MYFSIFTLLIGFSIAATAAVFSLIGLTTIFSGATFAIVIMGSVLEIAKLTVASWLYRNWEKAHRLLRGYLLGAVVILVMITSLGIFGFLSKAHLEQTQNIEPIQIQVELLEKQISIERGYLDSAQQQLKNLDDAVSVYLKFDRATKGLALKQKQSEERKLLQEQIERSSKNILFLEEKKLPFKRQMQKLESEVGPIKYVAEMMHGKNAGNFIDQTVRILIIIFIFVFDPLAVLLVVAGNASLEEDIKNKKINLNLFQKKKRKYVRRKPSKNTKAIEIKDNLIKEIDEPDETKIKKYVNLNDIQKGE